MLAVNRILVPIDFSTHATQALRYARELAAMHSASVGLLHVIEEPSFPAFYKVGEEALYGEVTSLRERAKSALETCLEEAAGSEIPDGVSIHIDEGKASGTIVQFAEEQDIDLIVISTHGLTGVERALMGSVAERVVRHAPCPVFVVKAFGKSLLEAPSES